MADRLIILSLSIEAPALAFAHSSLIRSDAINSGNDTFPPPSRGQATFGPRAILRMRATLRPSAAQQ